MKLKLLPALLGLSGLFLWSCGNHDFSRIPKHANPRWEYAQNMYHSEAYEPYTLIDDSISYPQSYNMMPYNKSRSNLREPVAGTVKRGWTPYTISKDSLVYASNTLVSPLRADSTVNEALVEEGQLLYLRYCAHCHGEAGDGQGPVSGKLKGIANIASGALGQVSEGHIYHVITKGKGRMLQHGSQVAPEDRWKIAYYIKEKIQQK